MYQGWYRCVVCPSQRTNSAAATAGDMLKSRTLFMQVYNLLTREEELKTLKRFSKNPNENIIFYKVVDLFEYCNFDIKFVFYKVMNFIVLHLFKKPNCQQHLEIPSFSRDG
jgi:hypothetical protein